MTTTAVPVVRRALTATYRLQLHSEFGFDDAAAVVPRLAGLGISHLYLSPILQAVPGSAHGYDVLDHTRLSADLGGAPAFQRLTGRAHEYGLGIVVDVVPNHLARATPESANAPFWSVLREGRQSEYAGWFDVDWDAQGGRILLPVLGSPLSEVLANGELTVTDGPDGGLLHYYDHAFPLRSGTSSLPLAELVDAQHYRLAWWKTASTELNYRRFFDVDSLVAIRVEDSAVWEATHRVLLDCFRSGAVDGFRIDHPDGLYDPRDYLQRLADATSSAEDPDGTWVVAEKILAEGEQLPADWPCAGTTGYDALNLVQGLFVDPMGREPLLRLWTELTGDGRGAEAIVAESKRLVATTVLAAETERLTRLAVGVAVDRRSDLSASRLRAAITELLLGMVVYRGYAGTEQGAAVIAGAEARAAARAPDLAAELEFVRVLATDAATFPEFTARFGQTAGPVMAKGIEDTAFYRFHPLSCLTEVGGDAGLFGVAADDFHAWCTAAAAEHPAGMTTLSTHDTKRSEDTRARLVVLSEAAGEWQAVVARVRAASAAYRPVVLDGSTESLIWQTLYAVSPWGGAGAVTAKRLHAYLEKAVREAKLHTTWTAPDETYETALHAFADALLEDPAVTDELAAFADGPAQAGVRAVTLGQKLVQLTMPGVPDLYQGCEIVSRTLVDPDNRDAVDHDGIERRQHRLDDHGPGTGLDDEKLLVVSRALRLRRELPEVFAGSYTALATGTPSAVAFLRGGRVAVVVSRFLARPTEPGPGDAAGPGDAVAAGHAAGAARVGLPAGTWTDLLSGLTVTVDDEGVALRELLSALPVALLRKVSA